MIAPIETPELWRTEAIQLAVEKLVRSRGLACEELTEKQLGDAIAQALVSGDFVLCVHVDGGAQAVSYLPYRELESVKAKYNELIMAVASKFPEESRHETALRYIREAETACVGTESENKAST